MKTLLSEKEPVLLRSMTGQEYLLGIVDDFQQEIDYLNGNVAFQTFLRQRSEEKGATSIEEIRARLA